VSVLVVDDEPDALELVRVVLEAAGARVAVAKSANEALGMNDAFDLIVSDIGMPQVDGYTYIQRVRSRNSGGGPHAIALSAYPDVYSTLVPAFSSRSRDDSSLPPSFGITRSVTTRSICTPGFAAAVSASSPSLAHSTR